MANRKRTVLPVAVMAATGAVTALWLVFLSWVAYRTGLWLVR